MIINLLSDYRGVLTKEVYFTAGQYSIPDDMPESYANELVKAGRAEIVEEAKPEPIAEPESRDSLPKTTTTKRTTRRKKAA